MAVGKAKSRKVTKKAAKKVTKKKVAAKQSPAKKKVTKATAKKAAKTSVKVAKKTAQKVVLKGATKKSKPGVAEKTSEALAKKSLETAEAPKKSRKAAKAEVDSLLLLTKVGKKWKTLFDRSKKIKAPVYKMSQQYEAKTPIQHSVLGWGYILSNQNDRLEVLFKDGVKTLISNFKR